MYIHRTFLNAEVCKICYYHIKRTGVTISLANTSLSVTEGNSGTTTTVDLCVSLDSSPGPIDQNIEVVLNTIPGTAGELKCMHETY